MKLKKTRSFVRSFLIFSACLMLFHSDANGTTNTCEDGYTLDSRVRIIPSRTGTRSALPRQSSSLICGDDAQCGTLAGDYSGEVDAVMSEYGIFYYDTSWQMHLFMPLYTDTAEPVAESPEKYAAANWNRMAFFIQVDPNVPPEPLQSRFDGYDANNNRIYLTKGGFYRQNGVDYSGYPGESAIVEMELYVNSENQVVDHLMRVFDQNGDYAEDRKLEIGDEIDLPYWGTNDEAPGWDYGTSFELFSTVVQTPVFTRASWIPGREFPCDKCQFPLVQGEVYFRLVGEKFVLDAPGSDTGTVEYAFSPKQYMGRLGDMACSETPALTDVIISLQVAAGISSPHPLCFKDPDGSGKTGIPDALILLRQVADTDI